MAKIVVKFKGPNISAEGFGFTGGACDQGMQFLDNLLGAQDVSHKGEYYEQVIEPDTEISF